MAAMADLQKWFDVKNSLNLLPETDLAKHAMSHVFFVSVLYRPGG